jgi:hypothetical protein
MRPWKFAIDDRVGTTRSTSRNTELFLPEMGDAKNRSRNRDRSGAPRAFLLTRPPGADTSHDRHRQSNPAPLQDLLPGVDDPKAAKIATERQALQPGYAKYFVLNARTDLIRGPDKIDTDQGESDAPRRHTKSFPKRQALPLVSDLRRPIPSNPEP